MSNWLEEQEHKQVLLRQQEALLEQAKAHKQALSLQGEQVAHERLKLFYALCHRVNGVRYGSLSIDRLKAEGPHRVIEKLEQFDDGDIYSGVQGWRGIHISCPDQHEVFIDLVITQRIYTDRKKFYENNTTVLRKTCAIQDLSDWQEQRILLVIQWMLLESAAINDSIPGVEIMTEKAAAEAAANAAKAAAKARSGKLLIRWQKEVRGIFLESFRNEFCVFGRPMPSELGFYLIAGSGIPSDQIEKIIGTIKKGESITTDLLDGQHEVAVGEWVLDGRWVGTGAYRKLGSATFQISTGKTTELRIRFKTPTSIEWD